MSNFNTFITKAFSVNNLNEYLELVKANPEIHSELSESGRKFLKYHFIPKDNEHGFYDSQSVCFCPECNEAIFNDFEPCENCFPQDDDHDDDYDLDDNF